MGIKFPTPWETLIIKFPPPRDGKGVKCPGYARGGGMLKLRFDRYIMSQWNETSFSLHLEKTKHEKKFFQLFAFLLLLTVSLSQRSYTNLFQHVKLCVTVILPQTQICKFLRTKFDTYTVLWRHEVLISLIILLQVMLSS